MATFVTGMRLLMIALIAAALVATLTDTSGLVPDSMVNIASYFTFQINIVCAAVLVALTWHRLRRAEPHPWIEWGRTFTAVNLAVVGVLYWTVVFPLGTEDGWQMTWVMVISHIVTPLYLAVEFLVVGTRTPLPLSRWWIIAGYTIVWNIATVVRSMYDDFIPYAHLDPGQRSWPTIVSTLALHSVLLIALTVVGLRWRGWRTVPEPAQFAGPLSRERAFSEVGHRGSVVQGDAGSVTHGADTATTAGAGGAAGAGRAATSADAGRAASVPARGRVSSSGPVG